jgi:hypothetical protein
MIEEKKEIIYCNLTLKKGKEIIELKNVVYKYNDGFFKNSRLGIKEPLKVLKVEKIVSLGFENKLKSYTEVKKSNEKRNKITGAYE